MLKVYGYSGRSSKYLEMFSPEDDLLLLICRLLAGLLPGIFLLVLAKMSCGL